jgi:hypothetical protein
MNRSELETKTRKQLLALAEQAGIVNPRALAKAALVESLLAAPGAPAVAELPAGYGRTRLTLVEVEPHWVHAYWEVTDKDCAKAMKRCGALAEQAAWVLRFHDVTGVGFDDADAHDTFDVPVDLSAGNWYVNLWAGGKTYCAEIGLRSPDGTFAAVGRSGTVDVPADTASPRFETEWMKVEAASGRSEPAPEPQPAPLTAAAAEVVAAPPQTAPVPGMAPEVVPAVIADDTVSPPATASVQEQSSLPTVTPPESAPAGLSDADFRYAQLMEPPGPNGNHNGHVASDTFASALQDAPPSGQAAETQEPSPSSHSVGRFGMSSGALDAPEAAPSIKLELNADLIIYGRAVPGQTVEVCGRMVKVNADGTFSVRMALPLADGDAARSG